MTVRRTKTYSAPTGYVYQYHFEEIRSGQRRAGWEGSEYVFVVSRDRKHNFAVPVFFRRAALDACARTSGRPLTGTEAYAAVKMRLFRAFDELEDLEGERLNIEVTPENVSELLAALDIS